MTFTIPLPAIGYVAAFAAGAAAGAFFGVWILLVLLFPKSKKPGGGWTR